MEVLVISAVVMGLLADALALTALLIALLAFRKNAVKEEVMKIPDYIDPLPPPRSKTMWDE